MPHHVYLCKKGPTPDQTPLSRVHSFYKITCLSRSWIKIITVSFFTKLKKNQYNLPTKIIFVCLEFSSHSRIFHSFGDVNIAGEGLQILLGTYSH